MSTDNRYYDVIIIGCGAAGIAAGIELQEQSSETKFLILEARHRIGGRAWTIDSDIFGFPIDLGASWIHHYSPTNPFYRYHQQLKIDEEEIIDFEDHSCCSLFIDYDGEKIPSNVSYQANRIGENLIELLNDYKEVEINQDKSVEEVIKEKYDQIKDEQIKRYVDFFLSKLEYYEASNISKLSAKYWNSENDTIQCNIALKSGYGNFLTQIATQLHQLPIQLDTIVNSIDTNDPIYIYIHTSNSIVYKCKYVLITVPLGCLKIHTIEFKPQLPEWKMQAIISMGYGLMNKIVLQFSSNFWGNNITQIHHASRDTRGIFRYIISTPKSNILILFVVDHFAHELEELTDQEIIEHVMTFLRKIFPHVTIEQPLKFQISRWSNDKFSCGSFSNFPVNANQQTVKDLARECSEGRLHWAGEHTNYGNSIGCVDSAFESGQREAKKLLKKLNIK